MGRLPYADLGLPRTAPNAGSLQASGGEIPFSFLWDSAKLADMERSSILWKRVRGSLGQVDSRFGKFDASGRASEEARLLRGCLILQERIKGIVGAIELTHSAYYSNDDVIRGIASFLVSGKVELIDTGDSKWSFWDGPTCPSTG